MAPRHDTLLLLIVAAALVLAPSDPAEVNAYRSLYTTRFAAFLNVQSELVKRIECANQLTNTDVRAIVQEIEKAREQMKSVDFWMRYSGPLQYKYINGPLPVEWETEVFEKHEKPYKREGAGLTLAELYIEEPNADKQELLRLVSTGVSATKAFMADSITEQLDRPDHFFLANRLFLLNLAAIYTTGFECPDTARVIPELRHMLNEVKEIYVSFERTFPSSALSLEYRSRYDELIAFTNSQPSYYSCFDHFSFIRDFVDPLFAMNQQCIRDLHVRSSSYMDYSLTKSSTSIFNKDLYVGQEPKGIFRRVDDPRVLASIGNLGRSLFHDPILSGNNQRSCASCHRPEAYFTDTRATAPSFDHKGNLQRNTPTLLNAVHNHLLMVDGRHFDLQAQAHGVITSPTEMGATEADVLRKILSCPEYLKGFDDLVKYTPQETMVTMDHVVSTITFYYSTFSQAASPFDRAMSRQGTVDPEVRHGFNLFMSKAQCGTCHFVPHFNGVKPPYIGSEFEVIGVPEDTTYNALSDDRGRYAINPADETLHAFRTGSLRNISHTAPYMHNGVFTTLHQVIDFYDNGGGAGRNLIVPNQTLSSDQLHLTQQEKISLVAFLGALTEDINFDHGPNQLPRSRIKALNSRKPGGDY